MGKLFGSTTQTTKTAPWKAQQPYLKEGFAAASGALDTALATPGYTGPYHSGMTEQQTGALNSAYDYFMTQPKLGQDLSNQGQANVAAGAQFGTNAQQLLQQAGQDQTQRTIDNAGRFADNPHIQGVIDAGINDVRTAFGQDRQGINAGAAGTGNMNSTRAANLEAQAMNNRERQALDLSANIRNNAWQNGLQMANMQGQQGFQNSLAANNQMAGAGALGLNTVAGGQQIAGAGYNAATAAADRFQQDANLGIDRTMAGMNYTRGADLNLVGQYMGAVSGNYGGTASQPGPSPFQTALGLASTAAGIYSGFNMCWVARAAYGENDPRWKIFRVWLLVQAPEWFYKLYERHGEGFANWLNRWPIFKPVIRGLMNIAIRKGVLWRA